MAKCIIENCNQNALLNKRFCRTHYIEDMEKVYLDNTTETLGIVKWLRDMMPEHYRQSFPKEHIEVYLMLLRLYDGRYLSKIQRLRYLIAFRSFAKSKIIFGFVLYLMCHNGRTMKFISSDNQVIETKIFEKLMVIFSETATMSEEFVTNIRDELSTNSMLKYFYQFSISDAKDDDTGQWTRKAFKYNGAYLLGLGTGQQARGKIRGAYRPTFIFADDIYSENNTATEDSRNKIKRWFYNSAMKTLDNLLGKSFLVGTIISDDTVLVEVKDSTTWKGLIFTPMPIEKFYKLINEHLKVDLNRDKCILPYEDEGDEFEVIDKQKKYFDDLSNSYDWELTWKDRIDLYQLALAYKEAVETSSINGFYQEYFHITISSELRMFRKEYYQKVKYEIINDNNTNWIKLMGADGGMITDKPIRINLYLGIDIAGFKESADNSCLSLVGIMSNKKKIVLKTIYGKFSMRDVVSLDNREKYDIWSRDNVDKIGYIDEALRLSKEYFIESIKIGIGGGSEGQILMEMDRVFKENGIYINIYGRPQTAREGSKEDRIKSALLPIYETYSMYHSFGLEKLEYELEFLGKAKNDDVADSVEIAFFNGQTPFEIDMDNYNNKNANRRAEIGYRSNLFRKAYKTIDEEYRWL